MARYWAQEEHKVVRDNTCCPTFLFANAGPWFAILGAIFSDKVIVQRLTDYIWVGMDSSLNEPHCNRVAKIMHSLKRNVQKLRDYYAGFKLEVIGPKDVHPRYFPSVRAYRDEDGRVVEFKYAKPLELHPTCVTFLADTFVDSPKQVVVKFVQRYGEDAHRILAKENLAPQLLYIGTIGVRDGDPSYGHLRMVVMEYIEGTTLDKARKLGQVPLSLGDQIKVALEHLHNNGFVFGDLRPPNVMITKNKELKLIDFDWAGEHMKTQYPLMMSPLLTWPTGVEGLSVMEKRHDDYMLSRLFPTS
jgi:serine/threonine protein kinase